MSRFAKNSQFEGAQSPSAHSNRMRLGRGLHYQDPGRPAGNVLDIRAAPNATDLLIAGQKYGNRRRVGIEVPQRLKGIEHLNDAALDITHTGPVGQSAFDPERMPGCGPGREDRVKVRGKEKGFIPLSRPVCQQMVSEIRLRNGSGFEPQALQFFGQDASARIDSFFAESPAVDIDKALEQRQHFILLPPEEVSQLVHSFIPHAGYPSAARSLTLRSHRKKYFWAQWSTGISVIMRKYTGTSVKCKLALWPKPGSGVLCDPGAGAHKTFQIGGVQEMSTSRRERLLEELQIGCGRARPVRAPRGTELHCKGWQQEAALRMLCNNLDPECGERPDELIVYGGTGRAARNWNCFDALVRCLLELENNETLLVQSGKPVGILSTHRWAPRVLIANSNLVPRWADWNHFNELEKKGLIMYGQMTAGSWIYIGTQGILQGTYETLATLAQQHWNATLRGKIAVSGGLGGMGGAQPLAVTMNEGVMVCVEVDRSRIERRLATRYLDVMTADIQEAVRIAKDAAQRKQPLSIGLLANAAEALHKMVDMGFIPDVVTDQTSAHDELNGYVPSGIPYEEALELRKSNPDLYVDMAMNSMAVHCRAILDMRQRGAVAFDYGNNLRAQAYKAGVKNAFDYPGFVPAYIRPLFCEGEGPFRWAALSGDLDDIAVTDDALIEAFPHKERMVRWLKLAGQKVAAYGAPGPHLLAWLRRA